jgi:hypothetical protein
LEKRKKGENEMNHYMDKNVKIWLILVTVVAVALLAAFWAVTYFPPFHPFGPRPMGDVRGDIELFYTVKTMISTVNVTLLIFLLATYIGIYKKTQSDFTVGLIIFSTILLLYALTSNPLLHWVFGFHAFGLGPFAMLPDLFTCVALAVLLYLTFKY